MGAKGKKLSNETKQRISQARKRQYRESLELRLAEPDRKRCSKCAKIKPVAEFYLRKYKLKSGSRKGPESACKACTNKQNRRWRERKKAEGVDMTALWRKSNAARESAERKKARLARRRELQALKRREEGCRVLGSRYPQRPNEGEYLEIEPLALFLEREMEIRSFEAISEAAASNQRQLSGILAREYKTVSLRVVDEFLSGLGVPHELHTLYPEA